MNINCIHKSAAAFAGLLVVGLSACSYPGNFWIRQNTDEANSGFRTLAAGASNFTNPTLQATIALTDGMVVGAVNLSLDDTALYVTEADDSGGGNTHSPSSIV